MTPVFRARVSRSFLGWLVSELPAPYWQHDVAWRVLDRHAERIVIDTPDEARDVLAHLERIGSSRFSGQRDGTGRHYTRRIASRLRARLSNPVRALP